MTVKTKNILKKEESRLNKKSFSEIPDNNKNIFSSVFLFSAKRAFLWKTTFLSIVSENSKTGTICWGQFERILIDS